MATGFSSFSATMPGYIKGVGGLQANQLQALRIRAAQNELERMRREEEAMAGAGAGLMDSPVPGAQPMMPPFQPPMGPMPPGPGVSSAPAQPAPMEGPMSPGGQMPSMMQPSAPPMQAAASATPRAQAPGGAAGGPGGGPGLPAIQPGAMTIEQVAQRIQARQPGISPAALFGAVQKVQGILAPQERMKLDQLQYLLTKAQTESQIGETQRKAKIDDTQRAAMAEIGQLLGPEGEITPEARRKFFDAGLGDDYIKAQIKSQYGADFSKSPTYITDGKGNLRILQLGSSGKPMQTEIPAGWSPVDPVKAIDTGTGTALIGSKTGAPTPGGAPAPAGAAPIVQGGVIPKDIAGREEQEKLGQAAGDAKVTLPQAELTAKQALATLDKLQKHPGRKYGQGSYAGRVPALPGSAYDFTKLEAQVKGQNFMTVIQQLRGLGALSNVEGDKAQAAASRLDRGLSDAEYDDAINEIRGIINDGIAVARKKAGGGKGAPPPTPDAPPPAAADSGIADGTTATNPKTGETIVYRGGRWNKVERGRDPSEAGRPSVPIR